MSKLSDEIKKEVYRKYAKEHEDSERSVFRENLICPICEIEVSYWNTNFKHMIPKHRGGPTRVYNLCVICKDCHYNSQGIEIWTYAGKKGFINPTLPSRIQVLIEWHNEDFLAVRKYIIHYCRTNNYSDWYARTHLGKSSDPIKCSGL